MASSKVTFTAPGRLIFGLMTFTIAFSLVGGEIEGAQGKKQSVNPFMIIFGGTVATSLLVLLSHAGDAGEELGVGLATITFVTAALVYGKPVWDAANTAFGSKPTTPVTATTPQTPAQGAATTALTLATGAT